MSVTDDIVEEIVVMCKNEGVTVLSGEVVNAFIENADTIGLLENEIEEKLKVKGITVGA